MPRPDNCPSTEIDPFAPEFLEDPYPRHESLREAGPVVWIDKYNLMAMARYSEVRMALRDFETYCSSRGVGLTDFATEEPWRPPSIILEADPPLHTRTHGVLMKVLSKPAIESLRDDFKRTADEMVDGLIEKGECDGVHHLAEAFPPRSRRCSREQASTSESSASTRARTPQPSPAAPRRRACGSDCA